MYKSKFKKKPIQNMKLSKNVNKKRKQNLIYTKYMYINIATGLRAKNQLKSSYVPSLDKQQKIYIVKERTNTYLYKYKI